MPEAFEVGSVKPASPDIRGIILQFTPGGGVRLVNATLRQAITLAYDVQEFQLSGGPGWLSADRFEILGKGSGDSGNDTSASQLARKRLQGLLEERFHLVIHKETKDLPVLALVLGRDARKLKPSGQGFDGISGRPGQISAERAGMQDLAAYLAGQLRRPVLDRTGLSGTYAFKLEWTPQLDGPAAAKVAADKAEAAGVSPSDPSGPSIFNALQEQLGLRLESVKAPVNTIIIDRAERPVAN